MSGTNSTPTIGICTDQNLPWPILREDWQRYDQLGFASLWDCDHYQQPSRPEGPFLEGWTLLAALAVETRRANIGILVSSNTFRHPALVAKMASTIDHVSGGRVEVGLGAGWFRPEHESFGVAFPEPAERVTQFREAVTIVDSMLRNEITTFHGTHYRLDLAHSRPLPVQKPRPRLTLGAHGPRMLRIVAEFADRWNSFGTTGELLERNAMLDEHCVDIGRDPKTIIRSMYGWASLLPFDPWQSVAAFDDMIGRYAEVGIEEFIVDAPSPAQTPVLEAVAEAFCQIRD